jgi:acyl carrier protein
MSLEQKIKDVIVKVLDVDESEIVGDKTLVQSLGVDSTELVEISVGIKKALNVPLGDGELKKTHTFDQIIEIVKSKGIN